MVYLDRYRKVNQHTRKLIFSLTLLLLGGFAWGQIIIEGLPESVCKNDAPYPLVPSPPDPGAVYAFSGLGVSGNQADGFFYDPASADVPVGSVEISLDYTPSGGSLTTYLYTVENLFVPTLGFSATPTCIPTEGGSVSFNNTTSGKFSVAAWTWNFGDAGSGSNNTSTLEAPSHNYPMPGTWDVRLSATTVDGCAAQLDQTIDLADAPTVDFTWVNDCYIRGQQTEFMNRSVSEFSDISSLVWTFRTTSGGVLGQVQSNDPDETISFPFTAQDEYNVSLEVENEVGCRGILTKPIIFKSIHRVSPSGLLETFDEDGTDWLVLSEDGLESWVLGEPDFVGFDPVAGDRGWYTSLPAHTSGYVERSWVQSQCYDLSQLSSPLVLIDVMKSFIPGMDGAVLQYEGLVSEGWKTIGVVGAGQNWYNSWGIFNEPGGSSFGWGLPVFTPDEEWLPAGYPIDELAGEALIKFRIAIGTGGRQASGNQGFAFDDFYIGQRARYSVLEHFTNSASESAASADQVVADFEQNHSDIVIDLQYHLDYPGEDPMNQNNPEVPSARAFSYGVPGVPYAVLNGQSGPEYRYNFSDASEEPDEEVLLEASLEIPPFDLNLELDFRTNSLSGVATATCAQAQYPSNIQLYLAVIEEEVTAYTGAGPTSLYRNVVLDMLPTAAGKLLGNDWESGESVSQNFSWTYADYVEDKNELAVVAFLFDREKKKVVQVAIEEAGPGTGIFDRSSEFERLHLYPNPARDKVFLSFGEPVDRKGEIQVLDLSGKVVLEAEIASGYKLRELDVSTLTEGIYLVSWIESGVTRGRSKLVLTR
jgi:hypothetical protein